MLSKIGSGNKERGWQQREGVATKRGEPQKESGSSKVEFVVQIRVKL